MPLVGICAGVPGTDIPTAAVAELDEEYISKMEDVLGERLRRRRRQRGILFGEHRGNLPLDCAVNARVGPVSFPAIQIRLGLFEALEALSF